MLHVSDVYRLHFIRYLDSSERSVFVAELVKWQSGHVAFVQRF